MKNIVILGASGSIGVQTLDVVSQHPDLLDCVGISVGHNITWLTDHLKQHSYACVVVKERHDFEGIKKEFPNQFFMYGEEGLTYLATLPNVDIVVNALVGFSGLVPTLKAIELKKTIALANKETLVVAGELVMKKAHEMGVSIYPIDSEHSAIYQALQGNTLDSVRRLIITASGGSFRNRSRDELAHVTVSDALKHPNWSMGSKITIDSATMVNKAFEVIEAHWLFSVPYSKIEAILHPESIVHSMVEYQDASIMAQLGLPDMRLPIQYALLGPNRYPLNSQFMDFTHLKALHFELLDTQRYPLFKRILEEAQRGGNRMAIVNAANEIAVGAFLDNKISFLTIEDLIEDALNQFTYQDISNLNQLLDLDYKVRVYVQTKIGA